MNKKTHAKLIIIRGLPGSGKSFIANNLQTAIKLRTDDNKTVLLDPDTIDYTSVDYKQHAKQLASGGAQPVGISASGAAVSTARWADCITACSQ